MFNRISCLAFVFAITLFTASANAQVKFQCIGAAVDTFVDCKSANPQATFFDCLPATFESYRQCTGQQRVRLINAIRIRANARTENSRINALHRQQSRSRNACR